MTATQLAEFLRGAGVNVVDIVESTDPMMEDSEVTLDKNFHIQVGTTTRYFSLNETVYDKNGKVDGIRFGKNVQQLFDLLKEIRKAGLL